MDMKSHFKYPFIYHILSLWLFLEFYYIVYIYNNATITSRGWWGVEYIICSIFLQIINVLEFILHLLHLMVTLAVLAGNGPCGSYACKVSKYVQVYTALCKDQGIFLMYFHLIYFTRNIVVSKYYSFWSNLHQFLLILRCQRIVLWYSYQPLHHMWKVPKQHHCCSQVVQLVNQCLGLVW